MQVALKDMTGTEWTLIDSSVITYDDIVQRLASDEILLCGGCGTQSAIDNASSFGLVFAHAYSVTGFQDFTGLQPDFGKCLRVLNPWGIGEYGGNEANILDNRIDGEFMIKWEEFVRNFRWITVKE